MLVKRLNHLFISVLFVFSFMLCFSCNKALFKPISNSNSNTDWQIISNNTNPFDPIELKNNKVVTPVDILIVVDDSKSMDRYQDMVKEQLSNLLTHIKDKTDWRIATTTTDPRKLCLRSHRDTQPNSLTTLYDFIITSESYRSNPAEAIKKFEKLISVETQGFGYEAGLYRALHALNLDPKKKCTFGDGSKFYRDNSKLVIIIVSDEFSNVTTQAHEGLNMTHQNQADVFLNTLRSIRSDSDFKVYGFLEGYDGSTECPSSVVPYITSEKDDSGDALRESYCPAYSAVIKKTGGLVKDITSTSAYGDAFTAISNDIATTLLSVRKYYINTNGTIINSVKLGTMIGGSFNAKLELSSYQYRIGGNSKLSWIEITDNSIDLTKYTHIKLN